MLLICWFSIFFSSKEKNRKRRRREKRLRDKFRTKAIVLGDPSVSCVGEAQCEGKMARRIAASGIRRPAGAEEEAERVGEGRWRMRM